MKVLEVIRVQSAAGSAPETRGSRISECLGKLM